MSEGKGGRSWLQIYRADTKGKILDISDPDPQVPFMDRGDDDFQKPKFVLGYVKYDPETTNAQVTHNHFVDVPTLRVLAWDLLTERIGIKGGEGRYSPILEEFKGGPASPAAKLLGVNPGDMLSRKLTVVFNDQLNIGPVYQFQFVVAEGEKGSKGQVMPVSGGKQYLREFINLSLPAARQFGATVSDFLKAKDVVGLLRRYPTP